MIRYVPNTLTVFRLLSLPVFVWLYGMQAPHFAWKAALFMWFSTWSDAADGYIARKYHVESEFGRILDPIVDRLFFLTVFGAYIAYGTMPWWAVAPVLARDVFLALFTMIAYGHAAEKPKVLRIGKIANFTLFWAIGFFMIAVRPVAWVLYVAGGALYLYSAALYVIRWARERHATPSQTPA
jgi:cardiolipin synthase (CMP-forming)